MIRDNIGDAFGGGIYGDFYTSPTIINNSIINNSILVAGGGIFLCSSSGTVKSNIVASNTSSFYGGGIASWCSNTTITNNLISENISDEGGGFFCVYNSPDVMNNTIVGNQGIKGGGVYCSNSASPTMTNSILWNNQAAEGSEIWLGETSYPSTLSISYSVVEGGQASCHVGPGCTLSWGAGMIDADPLFVDATGDDFHLTWDSLCKDTGDNTAVTELFDFEGDPRIAQGTVDMGADEFYYHLYQAGDVTPGAFIDVKVIGAPGMTPVTLALGSGIQDPPQSTPYGNLYLVLPTVKTFNLGGIPSTGVLLVPATVPTSWQTGEEYFFQALVGPLGFPDSILTNLMVLIVE